MSVLVIYYESFLSDGQQGGHHELLSIRRVRIPNDTPSIARPQLHNAKQAGSIGGYMSHFRMAFTHDPMMKAGYNTKENWTPTKTYYCLMIGWAGYGIRQQNAVELTLINL